MKKKNLVLITTITISLISIGYNIILLSVFGDFINEEDRLKNSTMELKLIGYPTHLFFEDLKKFNKIPVSEQDTILKLMNGTIIELLAIINEVIDSSGGVDENNFFTNSYGIKRVRNYFYGNNYYRNNAIDFFNQTMSNYLTKSQELEIPTTLVRSFKVRKQLLSSRMFDSMTLSETVAFLESICYVITMDKYNYLIKENVCQ